MIAALHSVRARLWQLSTRAWQLVTEVVVAMIALAVLGAVLGPQWDPAPMTSTLQVSTSSTAIGGARTLPDYPVRQWVVDVALDGATVQAQITAPVGAGENLPAVVFVHGAGTGLFSDAFVDQAGALARAGVVTVVPDKRLDTYSLGHRDYTAMAEDYLRSVAMARALPMVDPDRVGVYAESEGAWVAPVMAVKDPRVAFVVLVSAPVVPPRQQAAFATDNYLRNTGVPRGVFRAIPRAVGLSVPGAFEYADFDVSTWQQQLRQPVLVAYGTADASMPMIQGVEQILVDTAVAGNDQVTVRYYGGANHGLRVDGTVAPAFLDDLSGWVLGLPGTATATPRIAGATPVQEYRADPVPTPRWLSDGPVLIELIAAAAAIAALALLTWPVRVTVRRVRAARAHARGAAPPANGGFGPGIGRPAGWTVVGCLVTVAGLIWYLVAIARLALDYQRDWLVVTGGWLAVRAAGVSTVVACVLLGRAVLAGWRRRAAPAHGVLAWAGLALGTLGCLGLLVGLAYWGVFQLGI